MEVGTQCIEPIAGKQSLSTNLCFSDRFIPNITLPFLVMVAKDDKVCTYEQVPFNDLKRNKNCIFVDVQHGGHCDFFTKNPTSNDFLGYKRVSALSESDIM